MSASILIVSTQRQSHLASPDERCGFQFHSHVRFAGRRRPGDNSIAHIQPGLGNQRKQPIRDLLLAARLGQPEPLPRLLC